MSCILNFDVDIDLKGLYNREWVNVGVKGKV